MGSNQDKTVSISFSTLYAISSSLGIFCSAAILVLAWRKKVFKDTCQSRLLIAHTSFVDLLMSFFFLQCSIGFLRPSLLTAKRYICHSLSFFNGLIVSEVHSSILLLSIQRYSLIEIPLKARSIFTRSKTFLLIAFTWCFSLGFVVAAEVSNNEAKFLPSVGSCIFAPKAALAITILTQRALSFIITIFFYAKAYFAYRNNQKRLVDKQKLPDFSPQPEVAERSNDQGCKDEQESRQPCKKERSKSHPEIFFRRSRNSFRNGVSPEKMQKMQHSLSISEGIGSLKGHYSAISKDTQQGNSIQECSVKEREKLTCSYELRRRQIVVMPSSTRIQPIDMTHEDNIKYFKRKPPHVQSEEKERKRENDHQFKGCSKQRRADVATKSILIIMGYYLVTSLFLFILPNFEATLPNLDLDDRIIVIRSVHLLNSTNSVINFVVFFVLNKQFRLEVLKAFRCRT